MKRFLFFAFGALALLSINMERRVSLTRAVFAQQESQAKAAETSAVVVRELNLETLKKLLVRDESKEVRPLLGNFWATWCEPCREEFPDLVKIEADYNKRGLEMIFISLDDVAEIKTSVPKFLREMRAEKIPSYLLNVPDPQPAITAVDAEWKGALPATFLFDAQGKMVYKHTGRIKPAELRPVLDTVTKSSN